MGPLKSKIVFTLTIALVLALPQASKATTIDFSGLSNGTSVSNQYPGVVFSLHGGPDSSGSPTTFAYNGQEGLANSNNNDYPTANILNVAFSGPVSNVSFTFNNYGAGAPTTYTAFNSLNIPVATGDLQNVESFASVALSGITGITDLQLNNNLSSAQSWYFAVQKLSFDPASGTPAAVPLPASFVLMLTAMSVLILLRPMVQSKL